MFTAIIGCMRTNWGGENRNVCIFGLKILIVISIGFQSNRVESTVCKADSIVQNVEIMVSGTQLRLSAAVFDCFLWMSYLPVKIVINELRIMK